MDKHEVEENGTEVQPDEIGEMIDEMVRSVEEREVDQIENPPETPPEPSEPEVDEIEEPVEEPEEVPEPEPDPEPTVAEEEPSKPAVDEDEVTRMKREIQELRASLNEAMAPKPQEPPTEEPVETPAAPAAAPAQQKLKYFTVDDVDEIVGDTEKFNEMLTTVQDRMFQSVVSNIIPIVRMSVQQSQGVAEAAKKFYRDNSDLAEFRPAVAAKITEVHSENPQWTLQQIMDEAGKRTRAALKLGSPNPAQESQPTPAPKKKASGLPPGRNRGRRNQPADNRTDLERDIDEMLKFDS